MNIERLKLWTAALRSGNYRQTRGQLRDRGGTMCCLGVLCDISGVGEWKGLAYMGSECYPPQPVLEWIGADVEADIEVRSPSIESLDPDQPPEPGFVILAADANDGNEWTFEQIADGLERRCLT